MRCCSLAFLCALRWAIFGVQALELKQRQSIKAQIRNAEFDWDTFPPEIPRRAQNKTSPACVVWSNKVLRVFAFERFLKSCQTSEEINFLQEVSKSSVLGGWTLWSWSTSPPSSKFETKSKVLSVRSSVVIESNKPWLIQVGRGDAVVELELKEVQLFLGNHFSHKRRLPQDPVSLGPVVCVWGKKFKYPIGWRFWWFGCEFFQILRE